MSIYLRTTCSKLSLLRHPHYWSPKYARHASAAATAKTSNLQAQLRPTLAKKRKSKEDIIEERKNLSTKERLDEFDWIRKMENVATFDVWSQPMDLLDLHVPTSSVSWGNIRNGIKNVWAMREIAKVRGFPEVRGTKSLSPQIFKVQTTPWLAPFRKTVSDIYKEVQTAVATGDEKLIKKYTSDVYRNRLLKMLQSRDHRAIFRWQYHGSNDKEPCRVVSLRAIEANLSMEDPKFGNRLLVQALVKFDTNQTLSLYNGNGQIVKAQETPKRVVEHLVFQKRMWTMDPWVIRDQLYEGVDTKIRYN
ncbi:hypothetical protein QCA50_010794 [Cerrena zonata]|uniref:Large ribosomal subunit protein mL45 n=1 Tax=Cerrena zonata TaxID=2478898 RepID=A0AAW0G3T1_9APHY